MNFLEGRKMVLDGKGIVSDDEMEGVEENLVELRAFLFDWH